MSDKLTSFLMDDMCLVMVLSKNGGLAGVSEPYTDENTIHVKKEVDNDFFYWSGQEKNVN